ncbi:MAG: radical SAM protein [Spirochaetia bacterium]
MGASFVTAEVDGEGRVVLPPLLARRAGVRPGSRVRISEDEAGLRIGRSVNSLARLYLEPTSECNLRCRACVRGAWAEPAGRMDSGTWEKILAGICDLDPLPSLFLGGFGEPLLHPEIMDMVGDAKRCGMEVELITNGTLLDARTADSMVAVGLDRLWISLDGAVDEQFAAMREGGSLGAVVDNVQRLNAFRERSLAESPRIGHRGTPRIRRGGMPRIGISFVATRDTIASLPGVLRLGLRLMADRFSISNVVPHTLEMNDQALYRRSFYEPDLPPSERTPLVELPRMELNAATEAPLAQVLKGPFSVSVAGQRLVHGSCTCPFVEKGSMAIRWDGAVSPCLPLLHDHAIFLQERKRTMGSFFVGQVKERALLGIWNDPAYVALRERLLDFDFAPCTICNSCEQADSNRSDCFGNGLPACGGCLWAQGFIRCP